MPEDVYDGMLAYYHPASRYLTYTTVPQKPYKTNPRRILDEMDKLPCKRLDRLCPACQLFGTVVPGGNDAPEGSKVSGGYKGKVAVGMGKLTKPGDGDPGTITIRPLGTPKPTYYPLYVINNRRKKRQHQPSFMDYDRQEIRIGRKVYLHQEPEKLHYQTDQKTNLNVTIHPVPGGTTFKFEITFENLTNYELGLLLYSLDMEYKTKEVGYHLGMGKSLGLGSCRLKLGTVAHYDMAEHYKSLEGGHGAVLKNSEVQRLELIYQYVQGTNKEEIFYQRMDNVNNEKFGDIFMPDDNIIVQDYLDQKYIQEFHIFKSINVQPELKLNLPVHFAGGMETEGFKWYKAARSNQSQRLFEPDALEKDAQQGNELEKHALAP
jgi:CRISPR-associated protein (TIGR03986 family)